MEGELTSATACCGERFNHRPLCKQTTTEVFKTQEHQISVLSVKYKLRKKGFMLLFFAFKRNTWEKGQTIANWFDCSWPCKFITTLPTCGLCS